MSGGPEPRWDEQAGTEQRRLHLELMRKGMAVREAGRIAGIDRWTGRRRLNGRVPSGGRSGAPARTEGARRNGSGRYLRENERIRIADRPRENASLRTVAAEPGRPGHDSVRSRSTTPLTWRIMGAAA